MADNGLAKGTRDIFVDMLKDEAMAGSVARKYMCPFFYMNYLVIKKMPQTGEVATGGYLYETFDDRTYIRTDPAVVAEAAIESRIVGSRPSTAGRHIPVPVPLEETIE